MNKKKKTALPNPQDTVGDVPAGATRAAFDRDRAEGHGGPPHTPLRDRHAVGDPPETAVTGLAGLEDGDTRDVEGNDPLENGPPYSGPHGGAVGGTPAERRAKGGEIHGGLAPSSDTRPVDSTIGSNPSGKRRKKK